MQKYKISSHLIAAYQPLHCHYHVRPSRTRGMLRWRNKAWQTYRHVLESGGIPVKVRPHAQGVRIPPSAQCFGPKPCTQWTLAPLLPALTATQSPGGPGTPPWSVHTAQRPMPLALEPTLTYRASRDNTKTAIASATSRLPHGKSHKLR